MNALYYIIGILAFGFIVFVHELGHFIIARLSGVRVETFSLGFGPALFKIKRKDTVYQISAIPFGGFCKMAGEELKEEHTGAPDEFYSKPPLTRIFIVLGGVLFNLLFAILLFFIVALLPYQEILLPPKIYIPDSLQEYPAYKSGLRTGAVIREINGKKINYYTDLNSVIGLSMGKDIAIKYELDGKLNTATIKPEIEKDTGRTYIGVYNFLDPVIQDIEPGSDLLEKGISIGDRLIKLNNDDIICDIQFWLLLEQHIGDEITLVFQKPDGTSKSVEIYYQRGYDLKISFTPLPVTQNGLTFGKAIGNSFYRVKDTISMVFKSFGLMFSGKVNIKESIGGPVKVVYFSGEVAKTGVKNFLDFFGLLSIVLVIMNLLPIPAVDGSYVIFFLIELIRGKPIKKKILEGIQTYGIIILFALMAIILLNDILFIVK